ncbi:hypothetical protein VTN02DRAFT_6655 [Thermoascus thermophilus]
MASGSKAARQQGEKAERQQGSQATRQQGSKAARPSGSQAGSVGTPGRPEATTRAAQVSFFCFFFLMFLFCFSCCLFFCYIFLVFHLFLLFYAEETAPSLTSTASCIRCPPLPAPNLVRPSATLSSSLVSSRPRLCPSSFIFHLSFSCLFSWPGIAMNPHSS